MATTLKINGDSSGMEGRLYVEENSALCKADETATKYWGGNKFTDEAPCYIAPNKTSENLDYFQVRVGDARNWKCNVRRRLSSL